MEQAQVNPFVEKIQEIMTVTPQDSTAASEVVIARLATDCELLKSKNEQLIKYAESLYKENQTLLQLLNQFSDEAKAAREFDETFDKVEKGEVVEVVEGNDE